MALETTNTDTPILPEEIVQKYTFLFGWKYKFLTDDNQIEDESGNWIHTDIALKTDLILTNTEFDPNFSAETKQAKLEQIYNLVKDKQGEVSSLKSLIIDNNTVIYPLKSLNTVIDVTDIQPLEEGKFQDNGIYLIEIKTFKTATCGVQYYDWMDQEISFKQGEITIDPLHPFVLDNNLINLGYNCYPATTSITQDSSSTYAIYSPQYFSYQAAYEQNKTIKNLLYTLMEVDYLPLPPGTTEDTEIIPVIKKTINSVEIYAYISKLIDNINATTDYILRVICYKENCAPTNFQGAYYDFDTKKEVGVSKLITQYLPKNIDDSLLQELYSNNLTFSWKHKNIPDAYQEQPNAIFKGNDAPIDNIVDSIRVLTIKYYITPQWIVPRIIHIDLNRTSLLDEEKVIDLTQNLTYSDLFLDKIIITEHFTPGTAYEAQTVFSVIIPATGSEPEHEELRMITKDLSDKATETDFTNAWAPKYEADTKYEDGAIVYKKTGNDYTFFTYVVSTDGNYLEQIPVNYLLETIYKNNQDLTNNNSGIIDITDNIKIDDPDNVIKLSDINGENINLIGEYNSNPSFKITFNIYANNVYKTANNNFIYIDSEKLSTDTNKALVYSYTESLPMLNPDLIFADILTTPIGADKTIVIPHYIYTNTVDTKGWDTISTYKPNQAYSTTVPVEYNNSIYNLNENISAADNINWDSITNKSLATTTSLLTQDVFNFFTQNKGGRICKNLIPQDGAQILWDNKATVQEAINYFAGQKEGVINVLCDFPPVKMGTDNTINYILQNKKSENLGEATKSKLTFYYYYGVSIPYLDITKYFEKGLSIDIKVKICTSKDWTQSTLYIGSELEPKNTNYDGPFPALFTQYLSKSIERKPFKLIPNCTLHHKNKFTDTEYSTLDTNIYRGYSLHVDVPEGTESKDIELPEDIYNVSLNRYFQNSSDVILITNTNTSALAGVYQDMKNFSFIDLQYEVKNNDNQTVSKPLNHVAKGEALNSLSTFHYGVDLGSTFTGNCVYSKKATGSAIADTQIGNTIKSSLQSKTTGALPQVMVVAIMGAGGGGGGGCPYEGSGVGAPGGGSGGFGLWAISLPNADQLDMLTDANGVAYPNITLSCDGGGGGYAGERDKWGGNGSTFTAKITIHKKDKTTLEYSFTAEAGKAGSDAAPSMGLMDGGAGGSAPTGTGSNLLLLHSQAGSAGQKPRRSPTTTVSATSKFADTLNKVFKQQYNWLGIEIYECLYGNFEDTVKDISWEVSNSTQAAAVIKEGDEIDKMLESAGTNHTNIYQMFRAGVGSQAYGGYYIGGTGGPSVATPPSYFVNTDQNKYFSEGADCPEYARTPAGAGGNGGAHTYRKGSLRKGCRKGRPGGNAYIAIFC